MALVFLALGAADPAQGQFPNEIGLYLSPDEAGATGTSIFLAPVDVYLVLSRPTDVANGGAPYATVDAFECCLNFHGSENDVYIMGIGLAVPGVDIGPKNISQGTAQFIVGFGEPVEVVNRSVMLCRITFMKMSAAPTSVTLGPASPASIPGQMAFQSVGGQLRVMNSVGGSPTAPVFIFNGEAVAVENASFGSVKALYR